MRISSSSWLFGIVIFGLLITVPHVVTAHDDFKNELKNSWFSGKDYWSALNQRITVEGILQRSQKPEMGIIYQVDKDRFCAEFYDRESTTEKKSDFLKVSVYTTNYFFQLSKRHSEGGFAIEACQKMPDGGLEKDKIWAKRSLEIDIFLYSPIWVYEVPIEEILLEKDWKLDSITRQNEDSECAVYHVKATYEGDKYEYDRAIFTVASEFQYGLKSFELSYRKNSNNEYFRCKGSLDYFSDSKNNTPLLKNVFFETGTYSASNHSKPLRENKWSLIVNEVKRDCGRGIFTLKHYGLPDNFNLNEGSSWVPRWAVVVFVCLVLIVFFKRFLSPKPA